MSLAVVPGRRSKGSPADVLSHFGTTNGVGLGLRLLRDAVDRRDGDDVGMALIVCTAFGFTMAHLEWLVELAYADWHHEHEGIVWALGKLRAPAAVDALYHLAVWIPDYVRFDENRALEVNAVWALGKTPGPEADRALKRLLSADEEIVRNAAQAQLVRREAV